MANATESFDARPGYRLRLFEKTGLTMTADGSRDDRTTLEGVSEPYNSMGGATASDEDANFEGNIGSNDDDDPDTGNDINCGSDDEFSDKFSDENNEGSDVETTMMWQSPVIEHSGREGGCVGNPCRIRGNTTLLCPLLLRVPVKTCAYEILQTIETTGTSSRS